MTFKEALAALYVANGNAYAALFQEYPVGAKAYYIAGYQKRVEVKILGHSCLRTKVKGTRSQKEYWIHACRLEH